MTNPSKSSPKHQMPFPPHCCKAFQKLDSEVFNFLNFAEDSAHHFLNQARFHACYMVMNCLTLTRSNIIENTNANICMAAGKSASGKSHANATAHKMVKFITDSCFSKTSTGKTKEGLQRIYDKQHPNKAFLSYHKEFFKMAASESNYSSVLAHLITIYDEADTYSVDVSSKSLNDLDRQVFYYIQHSYFFDGTWRDIEKMHGSSNKNVVEVQEDFMNRILIMHFCKPMLKWKKKRSEIDIEDASYFKFLRKINYAAKDIEQQVRAANSADPDNQMIAERTLGVQLSKSIKKSLLEFIDGITEKYRASFLSNYGGELTEEQEEAASRIMDNASRIFNTIIGFEMLCRCGEENGYKKPKNLKSHSTQSDGDYPSKPSSEINISNEGRKFDLNQLSRVLNEILSNQSDVKEIFDYAYSVARVSVENVLTYTPYFQDDGLGDTTNAFEEKTIHGYKKLQRDYMNLQKRALELKTEQEKDKFLFEVLCIKDPDENHRKIYSEDDEGLLIRDLILNKGYVRKTWISIKTKQGCKSDEIIEMVKRLQTEDRFDEIEIDSPLSKNKGQNMMKLYKINFDGLVEYRWKEPPPLELLEEFEEFTF